MDELDADHLAFLVIALAAWWFAVPQAVGMLAGRAGDGPDERARQRAAVVNAARRLATPLVDVHASEIGHRRDPHLLG